MSHQYWSFELSQFIVSTYIHSINHKYYSHQLNDLIRVCTAYCYEPYNSQFKLNGNEIADPLHWKNEKIWGRQCLINKQPVTILNHSVFKFEVRLQAHFRNEFQMKFGIIDSTLGYGYLLTAYNTYDEFNGHLCREISIGKYCSHHQLDDEFSRSRDCHYFENNRTHIEDGDVLSFILDYDTNTVQVLVNKKLIISLHCHRKNIPSSFYPMVIQNIRKYVLDDWWRVKQLQTGHDILSYHLYHTDQQENDELWSNGNVFDVNTYGKYFYFVDNVRCSIANYCGGIDTLHDLFWKKYKLCDLHDILTNGDKYLDTYKLSWCGYDHAESELVYKKWTLSIDNDERNDKVFHVKDHSKECMSLWIMIELYQEWRRNQTQFLCDVLRDNFLSNTQKITNIIMDFAAQDIAGEYKTYIRRQFRSLCQNFLYFHCGKVSESLSYLMNNYSGWIYYSALKTYKPKNEMNNGNDDQLYDFEIRIENKSKYINQYVQLYDFERRIENKSKYINQYVHKIFKNKHQKRSRSERKKRNKFKKKNHNKVRFFEKIHIKTAINDWIYRSEVDVYAPCS